MSVGAPWTAVHARPGGAPLRLDVLAPSDPPTPAPAVLRFHGGAFIKGRRDAEANRHLAERGFVTISADAW